MQKLREYYLDVPRGITDRRLSSEEWRAFCANPIRWLAFAREKEDGYTEVVDSLWISGMAERLARGGWLLSLGRMVYEVQRPIRVRVAGEGDWHEPGTPTGVWFEILPVAVNGHRSGGEYLPGRCLRGRSDERGRATFDFRTFVSHG